MPTTTHDEGPPTEPPPAWALVHLGDQSHEPQLSLDSHVASREEFHDWVTPDSRNPSGLGHISEAGLLGLMSTQSTSPSVAREAWDEMYRRHVRYLFVAVSRSYSGLLNGEDEVSDIVGDTFQLAFNWAGRQARADEVVARFDAPDCDSVRRKVLGWLCVIARRLASHKLISRTDSPVEFLDGDIDSRSQEADDAEPPPSPMRALLAETLGKLSHDEVEALRVSLPWYEPATGEFAFPRGEAARAALSIGIAPDALRQRRHRSLKHLESLLRDGAGE